MGSEGYLELAFERFARAVAASGSKDAQSSLATALSKVTIELEDGVGIHNLQRINVHGVGGNYYVAKTSDPSQFVKWTDIVGRPDVNAIDMSKIYINASQIVNGTVSLLRLPIAEPGEVSTSLVRANDPRLSGGAMSVQRTTSEALAGGDWVNMHMVGSEAFVRRADATHPTGAIGFVADSVGSGEQATVFLAGENAFCNIPGVSTDDVERTVFLSSTPGKASLTPPDTPGMIIQPMGVIIRVSGTLATVLLRFEIRFQLQEP